jgi:hypothetical protein
MFTNGAGRSHGQPVGVLLWSHRQGGGVLLARRPSAPLPTGGRLMTRCTGRFHGQPVGVLFHRRIVSVLALGVLLVPGDG